MSGLRQGRLRMVVVGLYAMAMLLLGFAPHQLGPARAADPFLAAYTLPDGSVPDLCLTSTGEEEDHLGGGTCDACRLTAAPGLAAAPVGMALPIDVVLVSRVDSAVVLAVTTAVYGRAHPRGPPAISLTI